MADVFTKLAYVLDQTGQDGGAIDVAYVRPRPTNCNPAT